MRAQGESGRGNVQCVFVLTSREELTDMAHGVAEGCACVCAQLLGLQTKSGAQQTTTHPAPYNLDGLPDVCTAGHAG